MLLPSVNVSRLPVPPANRPLITFPVYVADVERTSKTDADVDADVTDTTPATWVVPVTVIPPDATVKPPVFVTKLPAVTWTPPSLTIVRPVVVTWLQRREGAAWIVGRQGVSCAHGSPETGHCCLQ